MSCSLYRLLTSSCLSCCASMLAYFVGCVFFLSVDRWSWPCDHRLGDKTARTLMKFKRRHIPSEACHRSTTAAGRQFFLLLYQMSARIVSTTDLWQNCNISPRGRGGYLSTGDCFALLPSNVLSTGAPMLCQLELREV